MSVALKHSLVPLVLVVPTAGFAIGLGDIQVESALNEPLAARIEIVGATPEDLQDLNAAIADRETFQRYSVERPSFLTSAQFKVARDSQGRPILQVTSSEPFTEPVVSLLVDLRWHKGELIREYPLLLDPADFAARADGTRTDVGTHIQKTETLVASSAAHVPESVNSRTAPPAASPARTVTAPARARTAPREPPSAAANAEPSGRPTPTVYRVSSHDTLTGVVHRVAKSRNESMAQRIMIAIFRANPAAFDGNINRLHRGARLTLPSSEALASISANEARVEVHAQMSAWHRNGFFAARQAALVSVRTPTPAPAPAPVEPTTPGAAEDNERNSASRSAPPPPAASAPTAAGASPGVSATAATVRPAPADASTNDSLERRIESLEQALNDTKRILSSEHASLESLQQYVAETTSSYPVTPAKSSAAKEIPADATEAPEHSRGTIWGLIGGAVALVMLTAWKWRTKRTHVPPKFPAVAHEENLATVLTDSPFAAEFKDRVATPAPAGAPRASRASISSSPAAPREAAKAVPVDAVPPLGATPSAPGDPNPAAADPVAADSGNTTTSLLIDSAVGEHTVNLAAPTQQIPVDTARLAALNDLERELEASYDPTATDVFEHVPIAQVQVAARSSGATAQHVHMPSKLTERPVVEQERMNIIEVLKKAIEADPRRLDLRLKLLEIYFNSDLAGREEFVEVARKLARTGELLSTSDWDKIAALGAHNESTAVTQEQKVPGKLADCA
jgi:FimV-like protein